MGRTRTALLLALPIMFTIGVWVGHELEEQKSPMHKDVRSAHSTPGQLTSPLLECADNPSELMIGERAVLEKDIVQYVREVRRAGLVTDIAVYFRDLNNGPWFGIDERKQFTPGSLLKLPIALSVYTRASEEPTVFEDQLTFDGTLPPSFATLNQGVEDRLKPGTYAVRDLVRVMLQDSSNAAAALLVGYQGPVRLESVFKDLGIEPPVMDTYSIDVKTYGAFFRVLYNASYIDQRGAEELLATMTDSSFTTGITAGVPEQVRVAHKFGTRVFAGGEVRQLHDCGIVYVPGAPYVLCIMTQGKRVADLEQVLAGVSKRVYEHVAP